MSAVFRANPNAAHLTAAKRIIGYLKGMVILDLNYVLSQLGTLIGFSDADWAGDQDDRSTTGNVFSLSGGAVSWFIKKPATVSLSTAKAVYE